MNTITNDKQACERALSGLKNVIDPEIGLNIVDLGLIYQLDFDHENGSIFLQMTLTTQFCPMGEAITGSVKRVMHTEFPGMNLVLGLCFSPAWSAARISDEGKLFLNS